MVAAVLISINWGMFIYGVNSEQVVEVSLGYFINPLVTVLAGVLVIGERLRPTQWVALAIAAAAVVGLTIAIGSPPWIALTLAFSFAGYGLVRKKADVGAVEGLTVETAARRTARRWATCGGWARRGRRSRSRGGRGTWCCWPPAAW